MTRHDLDPGRCAGSLALLLALLLAGPAHAEYLGGITFDMDQPSMLPHGVQVNVSIDYKIDAAEGRRIYVIPYTDGSPSPGYGVSGSAVYPPGTGAATATFTILSGEVHVDQVRVYSRNPDFTETPLEIFVPVNYSFGPHGLYNIATNHSPYSRLPYNRFLRVTFDYEVDAPGCIVFARPWNVDGLEPGYAASPSPFLPASGSAVQTFWFYGDADMTHILFRIYTQDQSVLLKEFMVPFDCHWREWGLYDISFDRESGTSLHNSQNVVASFTLEHDEADGLRVWAWSIQNGDYCPGSVYQPSIAEPPGPHAVTRFTRVNSGTQRVDHIAFLLRHDVDMEFHVPLVLDYGPHAMQHLDATPAAPAILSHGERLNLEWDYVTDAPLNLLMFARGGYEGAQVFGMTSSGSPVYTASSGTATYWMSYGSDTLTDSVNLWMTNTDQTVTYMDRFIPGHFAWAGSATITGADETPTAAAALGAPYPNPFNPSATIPITVASDSDVRLEVFDVRGRRVEVLHEGPLAAGPHAFVFEPRALASSAYICRLETPGGVETRPLTLVK